MGEPGQGVQMTDPFAGWPPVITDGRHSRLVKLRDVVLTLMMWGLLFAILYTELAFIFESLRVLLGRSEAVIDAELDAFARQMRPLMLLVAGLVLMLFVATLLSRRRRAEAVASPQPMPLEDARLLALTGLSADGLTDARGCKRAVVRRTDAGGLIVEP